MNTVIEVIFGTIGIVLAPIIFVGVVLAIPTIYILIRNSTVKHHRMFEEFRKQGRDARAAALVAEPEVVVRDVRCYTQAFPLLHLNNEGKWVK